MEIIFSAYDPFVKTLKTDKSARLELALNPQDISRLIELNQFAGELEVTIREKSTL